MKRHLKVFVLAAALAIAACASPDPNASPEQKALNATATSCKTIATAITTTDAAIKANAIKGGAADDAVKALTQAQAGCRAAATSLAAAAAPAASAAASGASK